MNQRFVLGFKIHTQVFIFSFSTGNKITDIRGTFDKYQKKEKKNPATCVISHFYANPFRYSQFTIKYAKHMDAHVKLFTKQVKFYLLKVTRVAAAFVRFHV